jgi:tol-pal system protein YbgF
MVGLTLTVPNIGRAQVVSIDADSLQKRLNALDMRLNALEKHRNMRSAALPADSASYTANDLENRMTDLEQEMSQGSGKVERATFAVQQLAKHVDELTKDLDLRLGDIEARLQKLETTPPPAAAPVAAAVTTVQPESEAPAAAEPASQTTPRAAAPATAAASSGLTPQEHYNKAYGYLSAADYPHAQAWLESFLKQYSKDPLADNAYYWLGEVYLVQNNPKAALVKFRDGLKAFPKGTKAPGNLYKMGIALEQLKQPELAKGAWSKLVKDHPQSAEAAKAKAKLAGVK